MDIELIEYSFQRVNHKSAEIEVIKVEDSNTEINSYVKTLLEDIKNKPSRRNFFLGRDTLEATRALRQLAGSEFASGSEILGKRLLDAETEAARVISHLEADIQSGVLFIAVASVDGLKEMIIAKADHNKFLDDKHGFRLAQGIPLKKRIYKAFLARVDDNDEVKFPFVYDTNPKMSKYWYDDFLSLEMTFTDDVNTTTAFKSLDANIFRKKKNEFPFDCDVLRNSTVRYFRANAAFSMEDYLEKVWDGYEPDSVDFPMGELIEKIKKLPERRGAEFDSQFNIVREKVNWKLVKDTVRLRDDIDLVIKQDIEDFHNIIKAEALAGRNGVWIASDRGYERFRKHE